MGCCVWKNRAMYVTSVTRMLSVYMITTQQSTSVSVMRGMKEMADPVQCQVIEEKYIEKVVVYLNVAHTVI